jgi:hypothetical protein
LCVAAMAIVLHALANVASAAALAVQSNPVANEFAGGGWSNPDAWTAIPRYPADPAGDAAPIDGFDWFYTQIAHDDNFVYLHYYNSHNFAGDRQLTYFDTDSNPSTGLPGFTGNLAIGAEYFISGAAWNSVDALGNITFEGWNDWNNVQDGDGKWHILVSLDRSNRLTGVTSFNFVNQNHGQGGDDWYPDGGNTFPDGDFFRYEISQPTVDAFGRTWNVFEPAHRDNPDLHAEIVGAADSLAMTGVFGGSADTRAITPLAVEVGTKVSYDFALTHDFVDPIGNGTEAWVADAFGAFASAIDPSNANLLTVRTGVVPYDDEADRIQFNDIALGELGSASLAGYPLANGVHVEWLFTSDTTVEVSVYSPDGSTLLGNKYVDTIEAGIASIQAFRFNLYDSEQTMTISDFLVEQAETLAGDYNGDGIVDAADYTVWRNSLNQAGPGLAADGTGPGLDGIPDGIVDANDYAFWKANFGNTLGGAATSVGAVPEPATLALGTVLIASVGWISRRRPVSRRSN